MPAKSQYPCEPRWGILWRQEDKLPSSTGLAGDIFDTAGKLSIWITLRLIFLLIPLRSPGLILKTQETEKGIWENPKSSHTKIGLNGKTPVPPITFSKVMGEAGRELMFLVLQAVGCGGDAPWIVCVRRFTCRVKYRKEIETIVDQVGSNRYMQD